MKSASRRNKRMGVTVALATFIAFLVFDYWTHPLLSPAPTQKFAQGADGIWIRYTWYFGEVDARMMTKPFEMAARQRFSLRVFSCAKCGKER
jgi:hypothetical protein